jgi:hypothetical protein
MAQAPNALWTWDITKLATWTKGAFLNLYVVLDLYVAEMRAPVQTHTILDKAAARPAE